MKELKPEPSKNKSADPLEQGQLILANIIARKHLTQTAARNLQVSSPDYRIIGKKNEKLSRTRGN